MQQQLSSIVGRPPVVLAVRVQDTVTFWSPPRVRRTGSSDGMSGRTVLGVVADSVERVVTGGGRWQRISVGALLRPHEPGDVVAEEKVIAFERLAVGIGQR